MRNIRVTKHKSSGLHPSYEQVISFDIEDTPFDKGAFGEVYFCSSVNQAPPHVPQVLKIFVDDGSGSAIRGYETIIKLQEQIISHNLYLKQRNEKPIQEVNALYALPQFSFEGVIGGKKVFGYSANLLDKSHWLLFANIFNEDDLIKRKELRNHFYNLPLDHRLKIALDLVEGFSYLGKMSFIYADLNPKNFFINQIDGQLCLIDYEGGAVNDNPETFGKPGEWLAPEIQEQLLNNNSNFIKVDLNTDTWAVAIGIHFIIFPFHPLFFLQVRGRNEMRKYFEHFQWPKVDKTDNNFRTDLAGVYDWYLDKLNTQVPEGIVKAFSDTVNKGYRNPNLRLSYKQWINSIKGLMIAPSLLKFEVDCPFIVDGMPVTFSWEVDKKAHTVLIDNGIGDVTGKSELKVMPICNSTYTLKVIGHFGENEKSIDIRVFPTPIIKSLHVPSPTFNHTTTISNLQLIAPDIKLSVRIIESEFVPCLTDFENLAKKANNYFLPTQVSINPISEVFETLQSGIKDILKRTL